MNGEMPLKLSNIIIKWQISHLDLEENMKFDKRFVFGAALVLGLGLNLSACGDDDKKDDEKPSDPPISEDSCKNGVLDAGEVCDTVDGKVVFAEGKGTCQLWYDENKDTETSPLVNDPEAVPGCASSCKAHSKGTCKTEAAVLCGNGQIDADEVCDIGKDGQAKTDDDVIADGKTCNDYQEGSWKDGGKPSCAKDCKGYGAGTCVSNDVAGGISKCTATVEYSADSKKATATVNVESESEYFTTVLCAPKANKLAAAISKDKELTASSEFDASTFSDAGDYACIVVAVEKENGNRSLCSPSGDILKIGDGVETFENAACGSFTLESQATADTLAKWTFASVNKDEVDTTIGGSGVAPDEGSENSLLLKYNKVGEKADKITLSMTADGSGTNALTAFQIKVSAAGDLGEGQSADAASHISIGTLADYSISSMKMSAKYGKKDSAKVYVTAIDGASENVVKELDVTGGDYKEYEVTGFASGATEIHIYGDNAAASAFALDDLTLVGAKK